MTYNGIHFYQEHWKTKTEAEFIAHEKHSGLTEKQLKEAFYLMFPDKRSKKENKKTEGE